MPDDSSRSARLPNGIRVRRERRSSLKIDPVEIAERVVKMAEEDRQARSDMTDRRLQLEAKYRLWSEGKDWPWEDSADIAVPDMQSHSLRVQDGLHNATMSGRPAVITAQPLAERSSDQEKGRNVDRLIDAQVFIEQPGEIAIGDLIECFVNDGVMTGFVPWVREEREVQSIRIFPAVQEGMLPSDYFRQILATTFPAFDAEAIDDDAWDYDLTHAETGEKGERVRFYTRAGGEVEMVTRAMKTVYDGPRIIPKRWDEVLHPTRVSNLQIPGPSNPRGAPHVILVDYPTVDEVVRLARKGTYNMIKKEDLERLGVTKMDVQPQQDEMEDQQDRFQGIEHNAQSKPKERSGHNTVTRLTCFDMYDIDGDGMLEDVIFTVIENPTILCRAMELTEAYPFRKPRRPFFEASFIPARGRREGISLLEQLEPMHDAVKMIVDQTLDAGTLANSPFGFYRETSSVKNTTIRMWPGDLYPLADPQRDINFPQMPNQMTAFGLNMMTLFSQWQERQDMMGDLQFGSVPAGRASALRTIGGMAMVQGQSEARPERILRRFFIGLTDCWKLIHELNLIFLPETKKIRIAGDLKPNEDPYQTITKSTDIPEAVDFDFAGNVFNTSKQALQQSLAQIMSVMITPLALQLGISNGETIYRLMRDFTRAWGHDPNQYSVPPSPAATGPRITAEEAFAEIMEGRMPDGAPVELGGAQEHYQRLLEIVNGDDNATDPESGEPVPSMALLKEELVPLLSQYLRKVLGLIQAELQQQQMMQAAQQFGAGNREGAGAGRPPEGPPAQDQGNPMVSGPNEILDETMPGAGGGGAQAQ